MSLCDQIGLALFDCDARVVQVCASRTLQWIYHISSLRMLSKIGTLMAQIYSASCIILPSMQHSFTTFVQAPTRGSWLLCTRSCVGSWRVQEAIAFEH